MAGADDSLCYCGLVQGLCGLVQVFLPPRSGRVLANKDGRTVSPRDAEISSEDSPPVAWALRFDDREEDLPPEAPAAGADLCSTSYQAVGRARSWRDVSGEEDSPPVSRELRFDDPEEDSSPVAPATGADLSSTSYHQEGGSTWSSRDVSDEEEDSPPVSRFDDQEEEEEEEEEDSSPVARNSPPQQTGLAGGVEDEDDDDDDCVILVGDPHGAVSMKGDKEGSAEDCSSDEELQIVAEKGQVACRDFPHSRHLCSNMPFGTTSHEKHCTMCYCFVCDAPAPCSYWGKALSVDDHCHATDKETKWKTLREAFRFKNLLVSHPEEETVVYPAMQSLARLSLGNQIPLQNVVTQNQHTEISVRASLNVAPAVNAQREGTGTSSLHTAQISYPLALTVSAPRASSVTRVQSGTSNGNRAQVTRVEPSVSAPRSHLAAGGGRCTSSVHTAEVAQLVEPTVSAPRPHPPAGAGRGTSNAHTALVTHPEESTVSAPRPYYVARTGRGTSNAHNTSHITHPVEPTVSSTRAYLAARTGRGIGNAHTAQITRPAEQTVSAPRVYPAVRAESDSSNAHSAQNTYSAPANGNLREPDAPEGATVYVGNLPYHINNERLRLRFQHAGVVLFSKVIYDRETGRSHGFGYITMNTVQEAETAVRIYHGSVVCGRSLTVNIAAPRGGARMDTTYRQSDSPLRIFVCNLPMQVDRFPPVSRFDDQEEEEESPVARNFPPQQTGLAGGVEDEDDDNDDCVILDGDPHGAVSMKGDKEGSAEDCSSDEELQIVAEKGQVACRDFPHSRHLCSNMPFGTTSHEKHCTMCYCFVCDAPAPCSYWGKALSVDDHCHATDKETKWKTLREAFRFKNVLVSHPEEETVVYPAMASLACLSLGNLIPLQNVVTQNQHTETSVRASLNVAPAVNAQREGTGTSSVHTAQISYPLALTVSAPRASSVTRVQSGTSNGNRAQVTRVEPTVSAPRSHLAAGGGRGTSSVAQLVEPTVGAPRPHPPAGAGRGTSNAHTALITHPEEPTVSSPRPYYAARTGRGTSSAHTSHLTRPVEPTVSSTRTYPAGRTGRGIGNTHTAQITRPAEQTVSAPRVYPAARAESDSSNAHSSQNTYSAPANGNLREPDAPEGATVYVGNLPYHINNERLRLRFQHAGVVLFSKVIYDRETGRSRGFGYVTMNTVQEAEMAVRIYHGSEVYGRLLTVNIAPPRGDARADTARHQSGSPLKIFVCNLPMQVGHSRLKEVFSKHGKVVDARVIYERQGGDLCSRGFGFVTMATEEESYSTIHALNKQILEGHALGVRVATERPEQGHLSLSNQIPLRSAVGRNQSSHTSVRASLNVAPTVGAPRARSGTSDAYTSQVTHQLDRTVSAPRPREHPVVG